MESITNLIVRRPYGSAGDAGGGLTIALNAHGDVVPPGEGWTQDPYGAAIEDGKLYGRAAAVSKSDFATFTYAVRALEAVARPSKGAVELHFTYDEEFGGILGPGWLLANNLTQPDLMVAAGFSYEVVTAHNGCLQMEVTVQGKMAHAAVPHTGVDALQAAVVLMNALYAENTKYQQVTSKVPGIKHPYLNIGRIEGGTNTNVVPGRSEEHTSELQSPCNLVCRLLLEKKKHIKTPDSFPPGLNANPFPYRIHSDTSPKTELQHDAAQRIVIEPDFILRHDPTDAPALVQ